MGLPQADSRLDVADVLNTNSYYALASNDLCLIGKSSNQSIASGSGLTKLTLDVAIYDPLSMFDAANNRINIKVAGYYRIGGTVRFAANATGHRGATCATNGATAGGIWALANATAGEQTHVHAMHPIAHLAVNDYVELFARQGSGGALNVLGNSGDTPALFVERLTFRPTTIALNAQLNARGDASAPNIHSVTSFSDAYARVELKVGSYGVGIVAYDTLIEDTSGFWDVGSPSRLVAPTDGGYIVIFTGGPDGGVADHDGGFLLRKNGTVSLTNNVFRQQSGIPCLGWIYAQLDLVAGDYLEVILSDTSALTYGQAVQRFSIFKRTEAFLFV